MKRQLLTILLVAAAGMAGAAEPGNAGSDPGSPKFWSGPPRAIPLSGEARSLRGPSGPSSSASLLDFLRHHRVLLHLIANAPNLGLVRAARPFASEKLVHPFETHFGPPPWIRAEGSLLFLTDAMGAALTRDRRANLLVIPAETRGQDEREARRTSPYPPPSDRFLLTPPLGAVLAQTPAFPPEIQVHWEASSGLLIVLDSEATSVTAIDPSGQVRWRHILPRLPGTSLEPLVHVPMTFENRNWKYGGPPRFNGTPIRSVSEYWANRGRFDLPNSARFVTSHGRQKFELEFDWCDLRVDVESGFLERYRD